MIIVVGIGETFIFVFRFLFFRFFVVVVVVVVVVAKWRKFTEVLVMEKNSETERSHDTYAMDVGKSSVLPSLYRWF